MKPCEHETIETRPPEDRHVTFGQLALTIILVTACNISLVGYAAWSRSLAAPQTSSPEFADQINRINAPSNRTHTALSR